VQIKVTKEVEIIEKYSTINLNQTNDSGTKNFLIYDYCNIAQSQIINNFFKIISDYFNSSDINNDKCFILDNIFNNYYSQFDKISEFNKDSFIYFTCPICHKDFKTNPLLNLHYKLEHMKLDESLICPGDFCLSINCNKYFEFFNIKRYSKEPNDVKFNRQPIEKEENCSDELIFFYKSNCMKLIDGCFGEDKQKYYKYYKYICNEISCKISIDSQISQESNFWEIVRFILMYLFGILSVIYLIIVWLTKFA
jgi:hypothetical protein